MKLTQGQLVERKVQTRMKMTTDFIRMPTQAKIVV